jgi:hypothetical protein
VKKPGLCPLTSAGEWVTAVNNGLGEVCSFHTLAIRPPLETMRGILSAPT